MTDPTTDVQSLNDVALLHLLQHQPHVGAAALYDRYGRVIFSVALRMVGDRTVAEEITQDVFVGCWRNAAQYRPEQGRVLTWLLGMTHHRSIDELRSRRHQARIRETPWDTAGTEHHADNDEWDVRVVQTTVRQALAELPPTQRQVIELLYFGGFTRQATAARLQIPLGTVHSRLRLGMAKLREVLRPLDKDDLGDTPDGPPAPMETNV